MTGFCAFAMTFDGGPMSGVRAANDHPDTFHFVQDAFTERGKARVVVVAPTANRIVAVIRNGHPTHAEIVKQLHQPVIAVVQRGHSLDIEQDRQFTGRARTIDIGEVMNQHITIVACCEPLTKRRQHS